LHIQNCLPVWCVATGGIRFERPKEWATVGNRKSSRDWSVRVVSLFSFFAFRAAACIKTIFGGSAGLFSYQESLYVVTTENGAFAVSLRLRREPKTRLTTEGLFAESSLLRASDTTQKFFADSQIENTRQRILWRANRMALGLLAKNFFVECNFSSLNKEILKNHFLPPKFFYPQHSLIQNLCLNLA
jgi:hypothetical protein